MKPAWRSQRRLTVASVRTALAAGVDELAHTPVEALPVDVVALLAAAGVTVVSTLQTFVDSGAGAGARANAAALHAAGVRLCYGTDLGNAGTQPGVDPRELERLAEAGLGRSGALLAATAGSAAAHGVRGGRGLLALGEPADAVVLDENPSSIRALVATARRRGCWSCRRGVGRASASTLGWRSVVAG